MGLAAAIYPGFERPSRLTPRAQTKLLDRVTLLSQSSGKPSRGALFFSRGRRVPLALPEVPGTDQLHPDRPVPALAQGRPRQGFALVSRGYGARGRRGRGL